MGLAQCPLYFHELAEELDYLDGSLVLGFSSVILVPNLESYITVLWIGGFDILKRSFMTADVLIWFRCNEMNSNISRTSQWME